MSTYFSKSVIMSMLKQKNLGEESIVDVECLGPQDRKRILSGITMLDGHPINVRTATTGQYISLLNFLMSIAAKAG